MRISKQALCGDIDGFSLYAVVRCGADDRQALEQLCSYITCPTLANGGAQTSTAGQVRLKLNTPCRDGIAQIKMSAPTFMLLSTEQSVCGAQIHWFQVCSGSSAVDCAESTTD